MTPPYALTLLVLLAAAATPPAPLGVPAPRDQTVLVVVARVEAATMTASPKLVREHDRFVVSNSCGYDTAVLEVTEVLSGSYETRRLAAIDTLGEWCNGIWQTGLREYLLVLRWSGVAWKVDRAYSSPLVRSKSSLWLVEPTVLEHLRSLGGPASESLDLPESLRIQLTTERLAKTGLVPEPGVSKRQRAREAAADCEEKSCWAGAPMTFNRGIELTALRGFFRDSTAVTKINETSAKKSD